MTFKGTQQFRFMLMASTTIMGLGTGNALAQDSTEMDEIVVTGVRASLARALDQKRNSDGITDGIASEDIIDYPDLNIADSLQRVTGVTVTRSLGEAQNIAVRGLAEQFTRVTINGQSVVSGNLGREVDFDVFASELFNNVQVSKSHSAELTEGGLAGTVDLRMARPFDYNKPVLAISAAGLYNDLSEKWSPRISGLASKTSANGKVGFLASISYSEQNLRQDNAEGLRIRTSDIDTDGDAVADLFGVEYPFIPRYVYETRDRKRLGITGALQLRPTDDFDINVDIAYADVEELRYRTSIDLCCSIGGGLNAAAQAGNLVVDSTNFVTDATITNGRYRSENINEPTDEDLFLLNVDTSYNVTDNLVAKGKIGYSEASRADREFRSTWAAFGDVRFFYPDPIFVGIEGVGGLDINDPSNYSSHQGRAIDDTVNDKEFSAQADLELTIANGFIDSLKTGVRFADREKDSIRFDGRENATSNFANFADVLPADNFFEGQSAATIPNSWPVITNFDAIRSTLLSPGFTPAQVLTSTNTITEETISGFVQADIDSLIGDRPIRGNVGIRIVNTQQEATGYPTSSTQVTVRGEYTEVLPSATFSYNFTDDLIARASVAKSLTRPTITDLTPGGTVSVSVPFASFGNPNLSPFTAWNYDASLEWYFADEALLSFSVFDKEIDGLVTRVTSSEVLGADVLGVTDPRVGTSFDVSRPVNGESGSVKGFEVSLQTPFSFLPAPFDGAGILANYTYADSEQEIVFGGMTVNTLIPFQSKNSYNLIGYYEQGPFSGRLAYSWRDEYLDDIRSGSERSNFIDAYGQLDANLQYNVNDNIVLTFDALNVLGQEQYRFGERKDRNIFFGESGRFYQFGVRAKF